MLTLSLHSRTQTVPLFIGEGLMQSLRTYIPEQYAQYAVVLITDSNIAPLYESALAEQLQICPRYKGSIVIPAGEASKSRAVRDTIEDELFARSCGRDTLLIAVGGGVVGDLSGFVASTFCRGIPFISIPTTLMAMTDSAIGGKTGINHPSGKNLLGAFYHPAAIVIDTRFLATLPQNEYISGLAEVIKYGCIGDTVLFNILEESVEDIVARMSVLVEMIIRRSVEQKIFVVSNDEKESGLRAILNFGHTTAHALEQCSGYALPHGFAVLQGMIVATLLSLHKQQIDTQTAMRIIRLILRYYADSSALHSYSVAELWRACASDKKNSGGSIKFVLLSALGQAEEPQAISFDEFETAIHSARLIMTHPASFSSSL
jgi:3-dehydroquinate synthase